ncbi:DUF1214 domain-containing protein [Aquipuribacter nitratireducens]|uniref:DUF1214 domain-containing protein n=1 Tax=Aquipuribacter nitratireducens TaxID=650104 RepID=A0ABW0GNX3_9MICO
MAAPVNVDSFVRAETARMLSDIQTSAGGVNRFRHNREPASVHEQTVIRLNRDTLYSFAVVDVSRGASVTLPDAGERYLSAMVVDEDHFVTAIHHAPGRHDLGAGRSDDAGGSHVLVAVRVLVDAADPADLARVAALQDELVLTAGSAVPFSAPDTDPESLDDTRDALLRLASRLVSFDRMFGRRDQVEPVRHLIGTAAGWGGLPTTEAAYAGLDPRLPPGRYDMTFTDVPVDAFWSVSVYDASGYFAPNASGRYSVNSVMGDKDGDGSVTVRFLPADVEPELPNAIPVPEGWNILVRLYRPRREVLDGTWTLPPLVPAEPDGR